MLSLSPFVCALSLPLSGFALWLNERSRARIRQLEDAGAAHIETAETLAIASSELKALQARFESIESSRREQAEWAAQTDSLNLNRRGQVLRLHRRGDSTTDIAKSLQLAVGEVALIIKVFEIGRSGDSGPLRAA